MNEPSHLFAGRRNPRRHHRPLLAPLPKITPTTRSAFGPWLCLLSAAAVVVAGLVIYWEMS